MTSEHDHPDEKALRELFDATAESAQGPTLTKLAARARDVPEREQRLPRWLPRWAWSPTLAGLAVAVGAATAGIAIAFSGSRELTERTPTSVARVYQPPESSSTAREATLPEDDLLDPDPLELELAMDWDDGLDSDADELDLEIDPSEGPSSDADLDAWLFATAEVLKEGS
jgi:hypothetical protein